MTARGECDCCGKYVEKLHHVWTHGLETYACAECCDILEEDDGDDEDEQITIPLPRT